jgi:fructose transport system substrate-binding protein
MRSRFGSQSRLRHAGNARVFLALALLMSAFPLLTAMQPAAAQDEEIIVGLITKTETNPFFVTMREGAQAAADAAGVTLLTGAGAADVDNAGQTAALENMVAAGAQGILITPGDTKAIVPAIQKARDAGILVIALDTPTEPMEAVDALFATDNFKAGYLIGQYARAVMGDTEPIIATLDTSPGVSVSVLRHNGFLAGYGGADESAATPTADMSVFAEDSRVVCSQDGQGNEALSLTGMENCLQANPEINLVYTINEPAARGAYTALQAVGRENDVVIVSVDGGCTGVEDVKAGKIAATSQQYPLKMAQMGVDAVVNFVKTGEAPSGYTDTGVTLITDEPVEGIESEDTTFGLENCWG